MYIINENHINSLKRLSIPSLIESTIEEFKNYINQFIWNIEEGENITIKKIEYILSQIYFNKQFRKNEFEYIKNNRELYTENDIENIFNKYSNQKISWEDWKKLIHTSGLTNWSMWKAWNNIEDRINSVKTISYFSIDASLRTWIHTWLFLQNIWKYFPNIKEKIFDEFSKNPDLSWWLALTELSSGTNLFSNFNTKYNDLWDWNFKIIWKKHLQWLSDEATHWIILAENKGKNWVFKLFYVDTRKENQNVEMVKERDMIDLDSITYWINKFDLIVSEKYSADIDWRLRKNFQSMLFESRMQFPAMLAWALERIYDESKMKSELRDIWWKMNINNSVQTKLNDMKIYSSIVNLINDFLIFKKIKLNKDNYQNEDLSIISKAVSTEYMQKSWNLWIDLAWWLWFEKNNIVRQMTSSARPFTRFEWVNEMLYSKLPRLKKKHIFKEEVVNLINNEYSINIQNNKNNKSDIFLLKLDDSIKWYILAKISIIEMIFEMWDEIWKKDEINFLLNEIWNEISKSKNIKTSFEFINN